MTDSDSLIISDPYRSPITAQKRQDGGVVLRGSRSMMILSEAELDRVVEFVRDEPRLGQLQRYTMTPQRPPSGRMTRPRVKMEHPTGLGSAVSQDLKYWP